jgi:hypothetical protein
MLDPTFPYYTTKDIQSCTVDVALADLTLNAYEIEQELRIKSDAEVVRLKKELKTYHDAEKAVLESLDEDFAQDLADMKITNNLLIAEGERRALKRVKEAIEKHRGCSSYHKVEDNGVNYYKATCLYAVLKELGLGEEEKKPWTGEVIKRIVTDEITFVEEDKK